MQPDPQEVKIAHLIPQFYPYIGGAEVCIHNVCRTLSESGHDAVVITTTPPPKDEPQLPYKIEYLSSRTCGFFRKLPHIVGTAYLKHSLSRLQSKYQFDLWQVTNGWPLGAFAVDFFRKNKIPSVLRCCGDDIQKFPEINYGVRLDKKTDAIIRKKFPLFDGFVALTPSVEEEYARIGISSEKVTQIPNGVHLSKFLPISKERRDEVRASLGLTEIEKPLIITVGRYHPKKGFDSIPRIAKILKGMGVEFNWLIVGRGTSKIKEKYPDCHEDGVFIKDSKGESFSKDAFNLPSQDLIEAYLASDIFALPTLIETFGMVLIEAMAAGLPIVTTDAPGVVHVVDDGVQGYKLPVGSDDKFAKTIAMILSEHSTYERLSAGARSSAQKYDWRLVTAKYIDLYSKISETCK